MKPSHRRFCYHYLKTLNASEAARLAGYKGRPNTIGPRLLANDVIRKHIESALNSAIAGDKATIKKRVLAELQAEAFNPDSRHRIKALELLSKYSDILSDKVTLQGDASVPLIIKWPDEP